MSEKLKLCPFCESPMMLVSEDESAQAPYLECTTCGLRFLAENFDENPTEITGD